jgi:hypothetical protein
MRAKIVSVHITAATELPHITPVMATTHSATASMVLATTMATASFEEE